MKNALYRLENHWKLTFFRPPLFQTTTDISLGILLHFWGVFQFTQAQPLPSPHKQSWTHVSRIFSEFQLCIGCGEGELQNKFWKRCTVLWGSPEITEQDPHSGGSLSCWLCIFSWKFTVTSKAMNKNRPVSLMKQETFGIIFNWDISIMHPLSPARPQNIAWEYKVTLLILPEIQNIIFALLLLIMTAAQPLMFKTLLYDSNILFLKTKFQFFFLSDIAFKALLTIYGKWICFYLTGWSTNSIFLSCKERLHMQGENCNKLELFPWGPWEGRLFLQLPHKVTTSSNTVFR